MFPPVVADLAHRFQARVIASTMAHEDWPAAAGEAAPGELWVSADLAALLHPRSEWVDGCPVLARDHTARRVDGSPRAYRQLDQDWYAWLYRATRSAKPRIEIRWPHLWKQMAERFNGLWTVARAWWPDEIKRLHDPAHISAAYTPPQPIITEGPPA